MTVGQERVFIGVGGNLDPEKNLTVGLEALARQVDILAVSTFYHTEPIGRPDQPHYYNGVLEIATDLEPGDLRNRVLRPIEAGVGRVRGSDAYAARPLDLDILLYGDRILSTPDQQIPDPDILERPFLIGGILEIVPQILWPGDQKPLADHASQPAIAALTPLPDFTAEMRTKLL
jgi:2-amino-4-hydroxy-6-hydroxymethyldihydropteridine diphosphokinase